MIRYRAAWLLPIADDPIRDGWVAVENGRIVSAGTGTVPAVIDLGHAVILPALVNAHTHLELSYLRRGVPPRRAVPGLDSAAHGRAAPAIPIRPTRAFSIAARRAIGEARASGTGLVGDVSNTLVTVPLLREAGMAGAGVLRAAWLQRRRRPRQACAEARARGSRSTGGRSRDVRIALAPHAPYSVSPELFQAIRADIDGDSDACVDRAPRRVGGGARVRAARRRAHGGTCSRRWARGTTRGRRPAVAGRIPGRPRVPRPRVLAVHGVQFTGDDLARLRSLGTTIVSCPRSNRHVGVGIPPLESFYAMGVSRGVRHRQPGERRQSEPVRRARRGAADRAAGAGARTCSRAPRDAARSALGFGERLRHASSQASARRSSPCACPAGVDDVEEYLVSGVEPSAITWLDAELPTPRFATPDRDGDCGKPSWELRHWELGVGKLGVDMIVHRLTTYLSFVRFSHSVFALPFALTGALLAWREQPFSWSQVAGSSSAW